MGEHLATCRDRRIVIATAQRDDSKYYVRSVKLEAPGPNGTLEIEEMLYLDTAHSDESLVVEKALEDASRYVMRTKDPSA